MFRSLAERVVGLADGELLDRLALARDAALFANHARPKDWPALAHALDPTGSRSTRLETA